HASRVPPSTNNCSFGQDFREAARINTGCPRPNSHREVARLPANHPPPRSYEGAMEEAERAAAGKLLHLVSPKTRKKGADNDQSDPPRRVYRTCRAVPVPRLRVGKR